MPDETKLNLEPIEEADLDLRKKFIEGNQEPREVPLAKVENVPEKAMEKREGQMEKDAAYAKILSKVPAQTPVIQDDVPKDAEKTNQEVDAQSRINNLVSLAQAKGVAHAVSVARHMQDNYILDEFHDKLVDELHDALVQKGLIRPI